MNASYKHGTRESYKKHKCRCTQCNAWFEANKLAALVDTLPPPSIESRPPQMDVPLPIPDIVSFLHSGLFNELTIDNLRGEWAATIKAHGDKYVGYGFGPDYALHEAVKRYYASRPDTGPITMTYNQTTFETSQGHGLDNGETTVEIAKIWEPGELEDSLDSPDARVPTIPLDD